MPKKVTTEDFIKRAKEVHGDRYDYSESVYVNSREKVTIICPDHGPFKQRPSHHTNGSGCPACGDVSISKTLTRSTGEFVDLAMKKHTNPTYDYSESEYVNSMTPVVIICPHHGRFSQLPNSHLQGNGCPSCGKNKIKSTIRVPFESFSLLNDKEFMYKRYNEIGSCKLAEELQVDRKTVSNYMTMHGIETNPNVGTSFAEKEIASYLKEEGLEFIEGDRKILDGKEIDLYIPQFQLGIEYNGLFWHSNKYVDNQYHLTKTNIAESKGIHLIQIFEDEWIDRKDIVLSKIKSLCGIIDHRVYARNTTVERKTNAEVKSFYNRTHIQGHADGSLSYCLVDKSNNMVACMSFINKKDGNWELSRFSTSCSVVGGFSKLLTHFKRNHHWKNIISFADRRWSKGNVYEKNGFTEVSRTYPNYYYILGQKRIRKQNFRRDSIKKKMKFFDPSLSEKENMEANGIYRIYDCGLIKYEINNT